MADVELSPLALGGTLSEFVVIFSHNSLTCMESSFFYFSSPVQDIRYDNICFEEECAEVTHAQTLRIVLRF